MAKKTKPAPATPPPPAFSITTAAAVKPPYRHEPTARTVAYHQPGPTGTTHLFSVTGAFVATVPTDSLPAPVKEPAKAV